MMGRYLFADRYVAVVEYEIEADSEEAAWKLAEEIQTGHDAELDFAGTEMLGSVDE